MLKHIEDLPTLGGKRSESLPPTESDRRETCIMFPAVEKSEILKYRIENGLTQKQFSERFGVPLRTVQKWEQGVARPTKSTMSLLKIVMGKFSPG
jgi:DNA-binding transcriptional regulator YiaG